MAEFLRLQDGLGWGDLCVAGDTWVKEDRLDILVGGRVAPGVVVLHCTQLLTLVDINLGG